MSDPDTSTSDTPRHQAEGTQARLARAAWGIAPVALALVGYAFFVAEGRDVDHEVHLIAPLEVREGDAIPIRALVFEGIRYPESVISSTHADLEIDLVVDEHVRASVRMTPAANTYEGSLSSAQISGEAELRARLIEDGVVLATARRSLFVSDDAAPAAIGGRLVSSLALLELGPLVLLDALDPTDANEADGDGVDELATSDRTAPPPLPSLDVRVVGGVCVPEEQCTLLVAAGDPFHVQIAQSAALTADADEFEHGAGVTRVPVVIHGPEAATSVRLFFADRAIAERSLRVPVALATPWLEVPPQVDAAVVSATLHPPPGRRAVIIDAYLLGRWVHTATMQPDDEHLPFALQAAGLWRLQAHVDPFSSDHAASRHVVVGPPIDVLAALRSEGLASTSWAGAPDAFVMAAAEEDVRALPAASSGLDADLAQLFARRLRVRWVGGIALVLGFLVLGGALLMRGLGADATARRVMKAAGDHDALGARARARGGLAVALIVGAILLAFLAGAALLFARAALG